MSSTIQKIAIIGGGVAGASTALILARYGYDVTLYEARDSLVSGPPFCHLHAGGNLYPDISDDQCLDLLEQSIDFAKLYPFIVDYRPTLIALPDTCERSVSDLLPRLKRLQSRYRELIEADPANTLLGDPKHYFRLYDRKRLEALSALPTPDQPHTFDEWLIAPAKMLDLDKLQMPLILVQEYGLNLFLLASALELSLKQFPNLSLHLKTRAKEVKQEDGSWSLTSDDGVAHYDYLINACGYQTGEIDDMIGIKDRRLVEFKAAYVTQCPELTAFPEIIFHGKRGTPQGMGQFTPYPQGHFQLHGMTKEITLFEEGLAQSSSTSAQPRLKPHLLHKLNRGWRWKTVEERSKRAISHLARFIPAFQSAKPATKPLYGAQQIPGDNPDLRVAEVSFPTDRYARCEIVKVSSVLDMIKAILADLGVEQSDLLKPLKVDEKEVEAYAKEIAQQRGYPPQMASLLIPKQLQCKE